MIRYSLRCNDEHGFESWFRDSDAYDEQSRAGLVSCPVCGSTDVSKTLMAPSVVTSRRKAAARPAPPPPEVPVADPAPVALIDEKALRLRALMREFRAQVMASTDDVGAAFPEEARKMHEGETEERPIRGEASADEVRSLLEDGIAILPIPPLSDDRN